METGRATAQSKKILRTFTSKKASTHHTRAHPHTHTHTQNCNCNCNCNRRIAAVLGIFQSSFYTQLYNRHCTACINRCQTLRRGLQKVAQCFNSLTNSGTYTDFTPINETRIPRIMLHFFCQSQTFFPSNLWLPYVQARASPTSNSCDAAAARLMLRNPFCSLMEQPLSIMISDKSGIDRIVTGAA